MTSAVRRIYVDGQSIDINVRLPKFVASPRLIHTGGLPARVSTDGTDATPAVTSTYLAEIYVPDNVTITGVALMNGTVAAGNITAGLYNSLGHPLLNGKSASTAMVGTDVYQLIPLALDLVPGTYFIGVQFDDITARFNTHVFGAFAAGEVTGQTYGVMPNVTLPTTFTTGKGPIASLY
jgi:hypothetical protein